MDSYRSDKKLILIVDDEPMILEVTGEFLKYAGFETATAPSAAEAMKSMEKKNADLVLLDIRLPDEDGLTFLKQFKKSFPLVPVVMLTGMGYDESTLQEALKYGAAGYVSKGIALETIVATVKKLLNESPDHRNP